jgi:hypothetical protein
MRSKKIVAATALSLALLGCLNGCTSNTQQAEISKMSQKIQQLERENSQLRNQLNSARQLAVSETTPATSVAAPQLVPAAHSPDSAGMQLALHPVFVDLDDVSQEPLIEDLAKLGVFDGLGNQFKPYEKISRGDYIIWLYKAYNAIQPPSKRLQMAADFDPGFKDLNAGHPCYKYVQALANAGYSVGYDDGTFRADQPLTREEMIGIKVGTDCGKDIPPYRSQMEFVWKFSDNKQIQEKFTGYIHQDYYTAGPYLIFIVRCFF